MEKEQLKKDTLVIIIATVILGLALSYPNQDWKLFLIYTATIFAVILINILAKKIFAYNLETDVTLSSWSTYWFGFTATSHYRKPMSMAWLPLVTSLITFGNFIWMPIMEFDVAARPERIARRHGLYRYTAVTEWHIALIAAAGIFANIILGIAGYIVGLETFAKWSIFYAAWSIIPLGRLDGAKIFFGSRKLWFTLLVILVIMLLWGLSIV
ncbi:MAG: hypothetical protein WCI72_06235 [archaeon]